jgi:hypothetical protein
MKCCYVLVLDFPKEVSVPTEGILGKFQGPKTVTVVEQELRQIHEDSGDDEAATELARTWKKARERYHRSPAIRSVLYQEVCNI